MAKKTRKSYDEVTAQRTAARRAHFKAGGSLATWRGRPARFQDRKKVANKRACRGKVAY